jgi:hypothetical protein
MTTGNLRQLTEPGALPAPWASSAVGDEPEAAMEALQKGLTVGLIATKSECLVTCQQSEPLSIVVERNRSDGFDFLPVIGDPTRADDARGKIIGLVEIAPYRQGDIPDCDIRSVMHPLSEENLIAADASILDFVREADRQRCRLVVSGIRISGLVSLSDLQKLPVRAALFGLVTCLEIIMTAAIQRESKGAEGWLQRLSDCRRGKIQTEISKAKIEDSFVNDLLFTQFGDKVTIIRKSPRFAFGTNAFKDDLGMIQKLRDGLAHDNDYASTPEAASETCRAVRLIEKWSAILLNWPEERT